MSESKLVYSTAVQVSKKQARPTKDVSVSGPCKMRLEKKGRGGKQVTILHNLPFSKMEAKALMRGLQESLGCGASYKDGEILVHGDQRTAIEAIFLAKNIKIVRSGA